jgi:hypothetical protein
MLSEDRLHALTDNPFAVKDLVASRSLRCMVGWEEWGALCIQQNQSQEHHAEKVCSYRSDTLLCYWIGD